MQLFYGTIPLMLILIGIYFRKQLLLKDILAKLVRTEGTLDRINEWLVKVEGEERP